jgi:hypothetical protein
MKREKRTIGRGKFRQKHNYNMAKMMLLQQNKTKNYMFGLYRPSSGFLQEISTSPRGLGKYITLFNKEIVKNLMMADIGRNM